MVVWCSQTKSADLPSAHRPCSCSSGLGDRSGQSNRPRRNGCLATRKSVGHPLTVLFIKTPRPTSRRGESLALRLARRSWALALSPGTIRGRLFCLLLFHHHHPFFFNWPPTYAAFPSPPPPFPPAFSNPRAPRLLRSTVAHHHYHALLPVQSIMLLTPPLSLALSLPLSCVKHPCNKQSMPLTMLSLPPLASPDATPPNDRWSSPSSV